MVPGTVAYIGMPHCRRWADTVFIGKEGRMLWNLFLWDRLGWLFLCPVKWFKVSSLRRLKNAFKKSLYMITVLTRS